MGFLLQITMSCPCAFSRQVAGAGCRCWCWCCELAVHVVETGCMFLLSGVYAGVFFSSEMTGHCQNSWLMRTNVGCLSSIVKTGMILIKREFR